MRKDSTEEDAIENSQADARKELVDRYTKPVVMDTFFVQNGQKVWVQFRHECMLDSGLVVPAKYNFDTNSDFTTHNFVSRVLFVSDKDTLLDRQITKQAFSSLLDSSLRAFAALLSPEFRLNRERAEISYNISIPATDVGIAAKISIDQRGKSVISRP